MEFINDSKQNIYTLFPDNFHFFELLAKLVDEEPLEVFGPLERSQMQWLGIEKDRPFSPDDEMKALLDEAARLGRAMARANSDLPHQTACEVRRGSPVHPRHAKLAASRLDEARENVIVANRLASTDTLKYQIIRLARFLDTVLRNSRPARTCTVNRLRR